MKLETKLILAFVLSLCIWAVYGLRSKEGTGEWSENSVRCVKLGANWQEPHGISPGWCKK